MSNQIHIIQNAITTTISEIFRGDFRRICEVKKAVLHLEAIYFCHGTCYLLKRENMPIKDQLALYQRIELIPQSTTEFFENNRECIINNWPEESALAAKPEILYDALLASEFCVHPSTELPASFWNNPIHDYQNTGLPLTEILRIHKNSPGRLYSHTHCSKQKSLNLSHASAFDPCSSLAHDK